MFYFSLQSSSEEENEKAFLILNEMILTLKDVSILFASFLFASSLLKGNNTTTKHVFNICFAFASTGERRT